MNDETRLLAELERIETELARQDEQLAQLHSLSSAAGDVEFLIAQDELDAFAEACRPRRAVAPPKPDTAIRC